MYSQFILLATLVCYCSAKAIANSRGNLLHKIQLSTSAGEATHTNLTIAVRDCGFIFCEAPNVHTNSTTHIWDYYVDWEMPSQAELDPNIFVLANEFQMPRSYLVLRSFSSNHTGQYSCVLKFRKQPIASHTLNLDIDLETASTKNCVGNN